MLSSGFGSWLGLGIATPGLLFVLAGILRGSRPTVSLGALGLSAAGLAAGIEGVGVSLVLPSVVGAVLAWDLATTAISVGTQLGTEAETTRLELVHAGASLVVGCLVATVAVTIYSLAPAATAPTVLLVLLVAVGLLLHALRYSTVGT
jgi:hypothetical protein